jgi:hypothetical protein
MQEGMISRLEFDGAKLLFVDVLSQIHFVQRVRQEFQIHFALRIQ